MNDIQRKNQQAFQKIKQAKNILLVCHERPDGDAVSSLCTMIDLCEMLDKKYAAFCVDKPEDVFSYLPHFENISNDKESLDFSQFDLIITLDCGQLERTKLTEEIKDRNSDQFVVEFDHHPKIYDYSNIEIRITAAASTTEVLYYFFKDNKIKINKNVANCILTGISTDTGNFLYPVTSDKTLEISAEMLKRGAQLPRVIRETWYNKSLVGMRLWGLALSRLEINQKYNLAFSVITQKDIKRIGAEDVDQEIFSAMAGFISNLHKVKGIIFFREEVDGKIKASLRSQDNKTDMSKLARVCGGGGHPKASGLIVEGRFEKHDKNWKII